MAGEGILKKFESYARFHHEFSLREFRNRCCPEEELGPLLVALLPTLSRLSLGWRGTGRDYWVFEISPRKPLTLSPSSALALTGQIRQGLEFERFQDLMHHYIERKIGKSWDDPVVLQRIRTGIMQQKGQYWSGKDSRRIVYRKGYAVLAYLAYHAPVYFTQFQYAFLMLIKDGLIPHNARILDIGSGPGVVSLAISAISRALPEFSAELFALERSEEFHECYRYFISQFPGKESGITAYPVINGDLRDIKTLLLPSSVDLIVLQNVTNELVQETPEQRSEYLKQASRILAPNGCMIIIEPAELRNSTELRKMVRAATSSDLQIHSPCTSIGKRHCAAEQCWSFVQKPSIPPTHLMQALAGDHDAFRFHNTDIKFSYAVLVKDDRKRHCFSPERDASFTRLSSLSRMLGKKVRVIGALMSGDLGDRRTHVFLFCDGTSRQPVYAILPHFHVSPLNQELLTLPYSSILEITDALVRFNKRYRSWNIFLTRNSIITPVCRASD